MSTYYSLTAQLKLDFNEHNIKRIIHLGRSIDFHYSERPFACLREASDNPDCQLAMNLSNDTVLQYLLYGDKQEIPGVRVNLYDLSFALFTLKNDDNSLTVSLGGPSVAWNRELEYDKIMLDNARFTRVLLNLVQNFCITNFSIDAELDKFSQYYLDANTLYMDISSGYNKQCAETIIWNGILVSGCLFFEDKECKQLYSIPKAIDILHEGIQNNTIVTFYIKANQNRAEVSILRGSIILTPLYPWYTKKDIDGNEGLDLAFYVKILLGLVENYAIFEMTSTF